MSPQCRDCQPAHCWNGFIEPVRQCVSARSLDNLTIRLDDISLGQGPMMWSDGLHQTSGTLDFIISWIEVVE